MGWNFLAFPIPKPPLAVGDMGVDGGEEDKEEPEVEKAAEEVVDDDVEEIDGERVCLGLLFTGVL